MGSYQKDPDRITYFAETDARGKKAKFGIRAKDRSKHMYVIGKTGMGKSTLLENLAIQDIQNGEGLAFVDPHGSSAEKLLDYIPEERVKDVVYFAPFDMEHPIAFNVMEDVGYDKRHLVVSGLMSAFKKIWVDAWSGRMEYILSNTLLALLEYPDSTLLDVSRMYTNKVFRKKVVDGVTDPLVRSFWVDEFAGYTDRYAQEATPAIQNKIGQFTSNPVIRNIIGQPKSTFDLREIMDNRKIFIANLSKGRVGETNADLLGSMLTTKLYLAAMSRADLTVQALAKLPDYYFYVDEFQSIANDSFANILSEARKYKLNLTIAHQYIEQMEENVRNAVFGNVGTTITFRVGPFDAEVLETVFKPHFLATDLVNLSFAQIYLTLMIDGVGSRPFSATTLPPIEPPRFSYYDQIIQNSRNKYGEARGVIEEKIASYSNELSENSKINQNKPKSGKKQTDKKFVAEKNTSYSTTNKTSYQRPAKQDISQKNSLRELLVNTQTQTKIKSKNSNISNHKTEGSHLKDLRSTLTRIAEGAGSKTIPPKKVSPKPVSPSKNYFIDKKVRKDKENVSDDVEIKKKEISREVLKKLLDIDEKH